MRLVALSAVVVCLFNTAAAAPLSLRGVASYLSADWGDAGNIYLSTKLYTCGPYPLALYGRAGPFTVDVLEYTNRTVLASLGGGWPAGNLSYIPDQPKGTWILMRVTDSEGNVAYTSDKKVKDGKYDKWLCRATKEGKHEELLHNVKVGMGIAAPFIFIGLLALLCGAADMWEKRQHAKGLRMAQIRREEAVEDGGIGQAEQVGNNGAAPPEAPREATLESGAVDAGAPPTASPGLPPPAYREAGWKG
ncbi:hypothetical protein JCM6882_004690 [Rhodosporidiobolus microsporus]